MFSRAKRWIRQVSGKPWLDNAVRVSDNIIMLVPPQGGWDASNMALTQRWLQAVHTKYGAENAMLFCSACAGLSGGGSNDICDEKAVRLGTESHFCPPQLAPEHKSCVALCRSVATWLETDATHVAVIAASRQRAALLAVCVQTYMNGDFQHPNHAILEKTLGKQLTVMCDRVKGRVPECHARRAHYLYLKQWARDMLARREADGALHSKSRGSPTSPGAASSGAGSEEGGAGNNNNDEDGGGGGGGDPWRPGRSVWIHDVVVSGIQRQSNHRLVAMISRGEELVFSSLNGTPRRQARRRLPRDVVARVPISREVDTDADLVARLYWMADATATTRPSQHLLCSVSFNVQFLKPCTPSSTTSGGGAAAGADAGARELTVTAADIDDADLPSSLRFTLRASPDEPEPEPVSDSDGGESRPPSAAGGIPIPIPARGHGSETAGSMMAFSVESDAELAQSLQRQFDLEAAAVGMPPSSLRSGGGSLAGRDSAGAGSLGRQSDVSGGGEGGGEDGEGGNDSPSPAAAGVASASPTGGGQGDDASPSPEAVSPASAAEQLAMDEALARALQSEFNQAISGRSGVRRSRRRTDVALTQALRENPAEFLRMAMERGGGDGRAFGPHCVATLPTGTVGVAQLDNECQVCFETYALGETFRTLPCMHIYHKECIDPWLLSKRNPTCPVCLTKVDQS
eukprot:m.43857 g.43857  ORF g.43857 m.43857 type:complete len:687 (+) comp6455_c0_seq1:86-2146(+)